MLNSILIRIRGALEYSEVDIIKDAGIDIIYLVFLRSGLPAVFGNSNGHRVCAPSLDKLFLYFDEAEFTQKLLRKKETSLVVAFNSID